ncbi:MAG: hypothetical protein IJC46_04030 [Clostridia bacterium]|nr:hypothetical protein [Clostridia bacterium]
MFIVHKNESSNKTIRMPNLLIEQLEELAATEDISFNQLVVQCCNYALANLPNSDGKLTCTEAFTKKKRQIKSEFIRHMEKQSTASKQSISQLFTDAIFITQPYNAHLGIDFFDLLTGQVSIEQYRAVLEAHFIETNKKSPVSLARDYANAFRQLKAFMETHDYL